MISGRHIFFLPSPSPLSFFRPRTYRKAYYFYSSQSSTVIKSKMAATTISRIPSRFRPRKIRLHCRLRTPPRISVVTLLHYITQKRARQQIYRKPNWSKRIPEEKHEKKSTQKHYKTMPIKTSRNDSNVYLKFFFSRQSTTLIETLRSRFGHLTANGKPRLAVSRYQSAHI